MHGGHEMFIQSFNHKSILKEKYHLGDLGIDLKIILKFTLKK
jgi:hypothetical protein